jgi:hypothetical protein
MSKVEKIEDLISKLEDIEQEVCNLKEAIENTVMHSAMPVDTDDPVDVMKWDLIIQHFKDLSYLQTHDLLKTL